ncbi:MAG: DUF2461 domain-containing protein [Bacteroidales bacterium]|nr:DUF2461 domain-containing protein [Bacteroidales bacterium]
MKQALEFLRELKQNNNREWFIENKSRYESSRKMIIQFLDQKMIPGLAAFDPSVQNIMGKQCLFRIYRDIRFSKDKTPYKTNFGASIGLAGRKLQTAGYYLHIEPGNSFIGGGIYHPTSEELKAIRKEVYYSIDKLNKIRSNPDFKKVFGDITGDQLQRAPLGFPKDFPHLELLRFKDYLVMKSLTDEELLKPDLDQYLLGIFKLQKPFNDFLNEALLNGNDEEVS